LLLCDNGETLEGDSDGALADMIGGDDDDVVVMNAVAVGGLQFFLAA